MASASPSTTGSIGSARTPQQETNFSAYMERALQAKPNAVYMFQPAGSPSVAFVKAYVERGLKTAGIKLLGGGETQELFLPNFTDDIVGTVTSMHYTETNNNPANLELRAQLKKMFGDKAVPDIASVAAWDGTMLMQQAVAALGPNADGLRYIDFMKGKKFDSPRGPVEIEVRSDRATSAGELVKFGQPVCREVSPYPDHRL
jgi:branched-chain amino acid transport system substrate-binding protein